MLKIVFKHSHLIDLKIISQTIQYRSWLNREGYHYYLFGTNVIKKINYKKITSDVKKEFEKYKIKLEKKVTVSKYYKIYLTKYGTYGSYDLPDKVYVNVFRTPKQIAETIVHEIVHLEFEDEVKRKKLTHDQKERLIDEKVAEILE